MHPALKEKLDLTINQKSFRIDVLTDLASLPEEKCKKLIDEFVELSYKTTGGTDWQSYQPAIEGWREYYNAVGARPQDYDQLLLIYDQDLLVHFTGVTRFNIEPSYRLVWIRTAMTLKEYHGAGLLKTAILFVISPEWGRRFWDVYFVIRTANPIVYEATRNLMREYTADSNLEISLYPQINKEGELDPVPGEIRDLAVLVTQRISPGCEFVPETFVNKGYFKSFGALYREPVFPCHNPATEQYFERVVDYSNQDGILILVRMQPRLTNIDAH